MKYKVRITEILEREVEVEADTMSEAIFEVQAEYHEELIVLDANDHTNTKFKIIVDEKVTRSNNDFTETPNLKDPSEIYYSGCGCTWGEDLDGKRYYKLYDGINSERYRHLTPGDIIDEKARIRKIMKEYLTELGII